MNRSQRQLTAQATLAILAAGAYRSPTGETVILKDELGRSIRRTELIRPADWPRIADTAAAQPRCAAEAKVEVTPETTLAASRRLVDGARDTAVLALNFASAKNPGGGFLNGSEAQEESLARASGLYPCLQTQPEYYTENRRCRSLLYTDHAIHSPAVPVFRDDADQLLDRPFSVGFLTMPAPNAGAASDGSVELAQAPEVLRRRVGQVLSLAVARGYRHVVLGAWGCGVFRNDPKVVADALATALTTWADRFEHVVFAVYDNSAEAPAHRAFALQFAASKERGVT